MNSLKVFLASAFGAGIGSLAAIEFGNNWWWLGLLIGAFVGFLSYEYQEIGSAIRNAREKISSWRPNYLRMKEIFWLIIAFELVFMSNVYAFVGVMICIPPTSIPHNFIPILLFANFAILAVYLYSILFIIGISYKEPKYYRKDILDCKKAIKRFNALSVLCYWAPKGIIYAVPRIPSAVKIAIRFLGNVFTFLYSEVRLLCGVNAILGGAIGYLYQSVYHNTTHHSILIGVLAGFVFGVLTYSIPPLLSPKFAHKN